MTEETLFHLALQQPAADRAAFLEQMCGDDEALRQRVAVLLHAADNPSDFLDQPSVKLEPTRDAPPAICPGSRIGPYKLLQQIGEGGMGTVFMAEQQEPVRRLVALKVIKLGMDSRPILARFEAERQALALMDHPNIARVLDAGTTDSGRPYFVMELVKGVPLLSYCDEHKLSPRQRLELFVPVCRAVQHAHQKGIIHRDLKPSNVLVALYDSKPVPKVIDFGVAKATGQKLTDKTLFTGFGSVVGTLEYMSPEQAELNQLDVDTRADIYSLGVLLYELLTGTTPLERKRLCAVALFECLRLIREEEPPKPSTRLSTAEGAVVAANRGLEPKKLSGLVRGDLDWIVMKCLEKDRDRRYETANGLASDVQRYLTDEPVLASPPSAAYRFRKFARRHKAGLRMTAAALLVLLLAAGGVVWVLGDRAEQRAARRLEQAARETETERAVTVALAKAEQLVEQARRLPSATGVEAAAVLLVWQQVDDTLAQAEAALSTGAANDRLRQRVAAMRAQADRGRASALRKEQLFRGLDEARMARSLWVDHHWDNAGAAAKYAAAFAAYGVDLAAGDTNTLARRLGGEEPEVRDALIVALDDWTHAAALGQTTPSAQDLRALAQAADRDAWRQRYRAALSAKDRGALRGLSVEARRSTLPPSSLILLAKNLSLREEHDEAVALLRWGRSRHPTDFWLHYELGVHLQLEQRGRSVESGRTPLEIEEAIACFRAALALRPTASVHNHLGMALKAKNQLDEAIAEYHTAIALDPKFPAPHNNLGLALQAKNQLDEAIAEYRTAIQLNPKLAVPHNNLALALQAKNQLEEAIAEYKKAIQLGPKLARPHNNLGRALQAKNQLDEAIAEYRTAIQLDPKYALAHKNLAIALAARKLDETITEHKKAIALDPDNALLHYRLGSALQARKQWGQAAAAFSQALTLQEDASVRLERGQIYAVQGRWEQAAADFARAFELQQPEDPFRWQDHALLRLQVGDAKGYQRICSEMVNRFGKREAQEYVRIVSATCVLAPNALDEATRVVALAERRQANLGPSFYSSFVLGQVFYLAGQYEQAVAALDKGLPLDTANKLSVLNWLPLALAHHRLGHADEARQWLDRAERWLDQTLRQTPPAAGEFAPPGWAWVDWLKVQLLLREARALIKKENAPPPK